MHSQIQMVEEQIQILMVVEEMEETIMHSQIQMVEEQFQI